jgi:2-polyprenyl-3-methyl-5-hydroxy-6-metoxy-1,4-benzoquinol methylase
MTTTYVPGARWSADDNRWESAKKILGNERVTLGPVASHSWLHQPDHLAMVLSRYRAAAALIGGAKNVLEIGCGEGIGAGILAKGREVYLGIDSDADAVEIAQAPYLDDVSRRFVVIGDVATERQALVDWIGDEFDAAILLDVIEHIPAAHEAMLMRNISENLTNQGVCVIGTPSKHAEHLASPQSRAGHVNLKTPAELKALVGQYFHVVQMLYSQDTSLHLGHPGMAHYLFAVGIGPR